MKIGALKEVFPGENRAAMTPDSAVALQKLGHACFVEAGAGQKAGFSDAAYAAAGVSVVPDAAALYAATDVITKVRPPTEAEVGHLRQGQTLISFFWPTQNPELLEQARAQGATVIAMDMVPRISRAQKMDALSSMANIAGYRAVIEAGNHFGRFFTGQVTAAGKVSWCHHLCLRCAPRGRRADRVHGRPVRLPGVRAGTGRRRHRRLCRALKPRVP
jgi:NAD(P) transhydrogenase subunit alpha